MKKLTAILVALGMTLCAFAQKPNVSGTVTDAVTGEPLIGVGVIVSTGGGTTTDIDGNYSVAAGADATITFNLLGFTDVVEKVNGRAKIDVFMKEDVKFLDEVVVMGYTSQKKNELSSSVVSLRGEELIDNSTPDLGNMIQGKAAGVVVMNASGQPGEEAQIRIRGTGSISASADPLYVVDGIAGGSFNANDVESVTILKDASATALYGASAAGGVIVVTTKSAKDRNRTEVNFKASAGIKQSLTGRFSPMGSKELYETQRMMYADENDFLAIRPAALLNQDYDWFHAIFKTGVVQDYYASVSGIAGRVNYFASIDHYDEQGSLISTGYKSNSARVNLASPIGKDVMLNIRLSYKRSSTDYSPYWMDTYAAYCYLPWDNPFDSNGNPLPIGMEGDTSVWLTKETYNPFHSLQYNYSRSYSEGSVADVQLVWNINDWLTFTSTNRLDSSNYTTKEYYDIRTNVQEAKGHGSLKQSFSGGWGVGLTELLKAHKSFGIHSFNGIVGYEVGWGHYESMGASGSDMPQGQQALSNCVANGVSGYEFDSASWAMLAQGQYSYKEKYIATASIRYDKTYKFAPDARGGFFPGASAAWIINKEPFMEDATMFDLLKLRVGYGKTGNSDIEPFKYQDLYKLDSKYNNTVAAVADQQSNPNLGWEVAYMASLGVEARMYDRINVSVDLYNTNNRDLLLEVPQAPSTGFTKYTANVGVINNKGIEFAMDADVLKKGALRWNVGFNIGLNKNTVVHLPNGDIPRGFGTPTVYQMISEGDDIYTWYMPVWAGVDPDTGSPLWETFVKVRAKDPTTGRNLYYKVDSEGNPTEETSIAVTKFPVYTGETVIETTNNYVKADKQKVGAATPKFTGGITSNLTWKNWSLGANFYFVYGNKVYNATRNTIDADGAYIDYNMMSLNNGLGWVRWDPNDPSTHEIATHPKPSITNKTSNSVSTRYLEDGSFIRLKNVTLAYNIPEPLFKGFIQGGRVYFSTDNLFTYTRFSGADPEVRLEGTDWSLAGMFQDNYPVPRSFILGIDLKF